MKARLLQRGYVNRKVLFYLASPFLSLAACFAQVTHASPTCSLKIQSLRSAVPFSSLPQNDQKKVLRALSDDIIEMSEIDIASQFSSHAKYRNYFVRHLEFETVAKKDATKRLLLLRYHSNTMCGEHENCPVWIVHIAHGKAESMVPWQKELGTSAGGGWALGVQPSLTSYPNLILLTHLSSTQTALACYQASKNNYLRVACAPECAQLLEHGDPDTGGQ